MAIYKLRIKKESIEVEVKLPAINIESTSLSQDIEIVRVGNVKEYLNAEGISYGKVLEGTTITNRSGPGGSALFVFEKPGAKKTPKKDLTPAPQPAIIKKEPQKKRKRVKRETKQDTGTETAS